MKKQIEKKRIVQMLLVAAAALVLTIFAKHYEFPDIRVSQEEELVLSGLKGEYEFLLLADLHLSLNDGADAGVYGNPAERIAYFSNSKGTPSAKQLLQWIAYANQKKFDAVLMIGDMIDYYTEENAGYLCESVQELKRPYLFTLGNHELFSPWDEPVAQNAGIYELFSKGSTAFQMLDFGEFFICAIDNNSYQVEPASLEAMREVFAANPDKPVILLAHVPFYTEYDPALLEQSVAVWNQALVIGTGEGTRDTTAVSREFLDLILGEDSPVAAIFTGDNHFYYKGKLNDTVTQWVLAPAFAGDGMILRIKGE